MFAISAGILLAAQSGCIGATLAGTDGSYNTPDTGLSGHAPVQAVTAEGMMLDLTVACQIADTFADMFFTGMLDVAYAVHAVLSLTAVGNIADTVSLKLDGVNDIATFVPQPQYAFAQTPPADAFVTTWTVSAGQNITINFVGDDMNISWGDGTTETNLSGSQTHTYENAGNHTVSVTGALTGLTLDRPDRGFLVPPGPVPELASIDQWGGISWTNMSNAFAGASNMTYSAIDTPDLSLVTDMSYMFDGATAFDGDLSSWDVSAVTDMNYTFATATAFNQSLSTWDVSSVTTMSGMFWSATAFDGDLSSWDVSSVTTMSDMFRSTTAFNQPLNDWDVSSVTDMNDMFRRTTAFNQPLNSWDVSSVTTMSRMFQGTTAFNQPLNDWDVSSVTAMNEMFDGATAFNQPLNSWDVSSVMSMGYMFNGATAFNQPLNDWDVSSVINMEDMFSGATAFDQDLSGWYVVQDPPVLTANVMFPIRAQNGYLDGLVSTYSIDDARFVMNGKTLSLNSTNLPPAGVHNLDITAPAVLGEPNAGVGGHTRTLIVTVKGEHLPFITTWRTTLPNQNITINFVGSDMDISWGDSMTETSVSGSQTHTYENAGNHTVSVTGALTGLTLDRPDDFVGRLVPELASIDQWGGISWTNMSNAFAGASNMVYNATDTPDLSLVTTMFFMFEGATAFDGDLSSWNVSSVTNMVGTFSSATSFNQTLNDWDVSSVTTMFFMFSGASSFNQPLNAWDVSSVRNMGYTFSDASSFNQPLNDWNVSSVTRMSYMLAKTDFNQPLNDWDVSSVTRMSYMFTGASSFNQLLNTWDVSSVTNMDSMFEGASSFNQLLNTWNVSSVTNMANMFDGATAFDQNLGNWYVVPDSMSIARTAVPGVVGTISAQNTPLNSHTPVYTIVTGSDSAQFEIVNGNKLNMTSVDTKSAYTVNVTASDGTVFEDGNNWRVLDVTVTTADDTTPPTLSLTGNTSVTISVDTPYNDEGATCEDGVDGTIIPTVVSNTVDIAQVGTYAVTYSCADVAGNAATQVSRTVIVEDTTPPTLSLTGNTSVTISVDTPYNDEGATCEDGVDGTIIPTVVSNTVDIAKVGTYAVTYSCADVAGNAATQVSRTVIVQTAVTPDTTPPTLSLTGNTSVTISVDTPYNDEGATCEDGVDGTIIPTVVSNTVDIAKVGIYAVTYSCADVAGNAATQVSRTVTVREAGPDTEPPTITLEGGIDIEITVDGIYNEQVACEDTVDDSPKLSIEGSIDTTILGEQYIFYTCTDESNNSVAVLRTVTVVVVIGTLPTIDAGDDQDVTKGSTYTLTGATATDIEDDDADLTIEWTQVPTGTVTITNGNTLTPAIDVPSTTTVTSVTLTMSVTDSANPAVTDTRVLTIQDAVVTDTPPTIYAGADQDVTKGSTYTLTGATATDIEDADDTLTIEWTQVPAGTVTITNGNTLTPTIEVPSTATVTSVTLTMSVTDSANPAVTDTRVLTIQDAVVTDTPPTIYAGADQDVTKGSTVTLTGATATDIEDDDADLTIEWTQVPAGTVTITNGNTLTPTIEVPSTATAPSVTLTMSVTDSDTNEVTDARVLTIQDAVNTAPTIYAGDDQDVTKGSTVTLTGATATDIEDDDADLTIEWTQVPAGTVTITNGNTLTPTIEVPSITTATSVTLTMSVTDSDTNEVTDARVLTIQDAVNTAPTIYAGDDQDVTKGSTVTLTGATATDIEDDDADLTIEWTQVPAGTVTITNGNTLTPTIEVPSITTATSVTLTMSVTDSDTNEVTDARVLTIQDAVNTAPTIYAGDDQDVTKGSTVTLTGATATDNEDADADLTIEWTQVPAGTVTITNGNTLTPTIEVPSTATATSVTLTMSVTDSDTNEVTDARVLTIQDTVVSDTPPTIYAGDDQDVTKGSTVTLTGATATDIEDDDADLTIEWTQVPAGTVTITNGNTLTPTIEVPSITTATSVTLTMSVTDSDTNEVTDARVLTIQDAVNTAPTIYAGDDQDVTKGSTVTLTGATATDNEDADDTLTIEWTQVPAGTVTITNGNTLTPTIEVPSITTATSVTLTMSVTDSDTNEVTDARVLTIQDAVNTAPTIYAGDDQDVTKGSTVTLTGATATDNEDADDTLTIEWTQVPAGTVTITNGNTLTPTIEVPSTATATSVTLTMSVTDSDTNEVTDARVLTIQDTVVSDTPPTIYAGDDQDVTKGSTVTLTGATATDIEDDDADLTIEWTQVPAGTVTITNGNTLTPTIEVPSITTATSVTLTMSVTDSDTNEVTDARVLTIQDAVNTAPTVYAGGPLRVALGSSVSTNPTVDDPDGDTDHTYTWTQSPVNTVTFSDVNSLRPTITAPVSTPITSVTLTLTVVDGGHTVSDDTTLNIYDPATISNKKSSSSSSTAPIVDLNTLVQARIVDIPPAILEQISSHDASDPLEPILHDDTFDCPLTINEYCYLLDDLTNTLTPQTVTADQSTEIAFTVYTKKDLTHFTLYLNMQGNNANYADSDTYITYTSDGTVEVTDPHGYIVDATITVTQEDDSMPEKKTVSITLYFDEPMGPTNMVAYMWNTDRKAAFIKIVDALEVVTSPESVVQTTDPEPAIPDSELPADPEPVAPDLAGDVVDPEPMPADTLWSDDYDEAQVLHIIRMWSGFESESITDAQLLELLGLEDYQDVDLPDWMMTQLGVLVAKGDVTVGEFVLALQYMLTHA